MGGSCSGLCLDPYKDSAREFDLTASERKDVYNKNKPRVKLMKRGAKGYEVKMKYTL